MNKFLLSSFIVTCTVLVSCKDKKVLLSSLFQDNEVSYSLKKSDYPVDSILKPDFIYSFDDFIILSEPQSDYLLSLYNIQTKDFYRCINKGNGPDELPDIQQIGLFNSHDAFFVKSTFAEKIFTFKSIDNRIDTLSAISIPDNLVSLFVDDDLLISSQYGNKRYSIYNYKNKSGIEFGESIPYNNFSQENVSHILQGLCTGSIEKKRIAWFSIYGDAYEIYDYSAPGNIKTIKQVLTLLPVSVMQSGTPSMDAKTKLGVPSVTSSDKYIYALYNENTLFDAASLRDDVFFSKKILVIDWDGNPVKLIHTDKELRSISFNRQQNILYGIGKDENANLNIYYLDNL